MISSGWLSLAASLGLTFGLLVGALVLLRRLQNRGTRTAVEIPLRVLKRIPVGPKQSVAVLQVSDRTLVVSIAENGTRLLAELDEPFGEERPALVSAENDSGVTERSPMGSFRRLLRGSLGISLALVLAIPAGARPDAGPGAAGSFGSPGSGPGIWIAAAALAAPQTATPDPRSGLPQVRVEIGEEGDGLRMTGTVGLVVVIGLLTLLPALFLLMTSFTRILIVLQFIRPALGTQTSPPTQLLAALAVLMTGVVMHPVLDQANRLALQPYLNGELRQEDALKTGLQPFREFMLANTREKDLATFLQLSGTEQVESVEEVPTVTLVSAFVTSELRTAFQMGFMIFLPFVVLDVIIASILMSLGMFMLPPMMVSLPFKLLLFVLADGWTLITQNLVTSFRF